jgi:hypothetical protein
MDEEVKTVRITHCGKPLTVAILLDRYAHGGRQVVQLVDARDLSDYATLSVNPLASLADDEFVFKTYSENEGLLEELVAAGVVETTGRFVNCGFAGPQPICRLCW